MPAENGCRTSENAANTIRKKEHYLHRIIFHPVYSAANQHPETFRAFLLCVPTENSGQE